MKYLKKYKIFESIENQFFKTYKETENWLDKMGINYYNINKDLTVDVRDNTKVGRWEKVEYIPIQFGKIEGNFDCNINKLKNLIGCPHYISGNFNAHNNLLDSTIGCPSYVGGSFDISDNNLFKFDFLPDNFYNKSIYVYGEYNSGDMVFLDENPIDELLDKIKIKDQILFIKYLNEYNVIKDKKIILDNLKEALYMIDINEMPDFDFDQYEVI